MFLDRSPSRIKIARGGSGIDINLSIQFILNCGTEVAGSCHGGSASGAYQFVHDYGSIPYDTCQPYLACSSDSDWGFCANADTSCNPSNVCKTCTMKLVPSLHPFDQICREIDHYPNTTIAEYGTIRLQDEQSAESVMDKVKAELFARGPVAAEVNGKELHTYQGGVYVNETASQKTTHIVAIVGWGELEDGRSFWVCRNSWGQAWGEMGYFRLLAGANVLGIEHSIAWATPGVFSTSNFPCNEGGENCGPSHHHYLDPSVDASVLQERLSLYR
jgi:cathepsin X